MINKCVFLYLSLFFVLRCIALIFVSGNIHAATVDITNKILPAPYSSPRPSADKKETNGYSTQNAPTDNIISNPIVSAEHPVNIAFTQYKPNTSTHNNSFGKPNNLIKTLFDEHAENSLVQATLLTFGKTRQLFNETENIINNITQHMLLELDQHLQLELFLPHTNIASGMRLQKNYGSGSISYVNRQQNYQPKSYRQQSYQLQSYRQQNYRQQSYSIAAYDENTIDEEGDNNFFKGLIHINTLYYMLAFIIIFSFLKRLLRFLLFGKYR